MTEAHQAHHPRATHLLLAVPVGPVPVGGQLLWAGDLWLAGYDLAEATGAAPCTVQLVDGQDNGGVPVSPIFTLAAGAARSVMFGGHLLTLRSGCFLRVTNGSAQAVAYLADK